MKRIGRILACLIIAGVATGCKGAPRPSPQTSPRPVKWLVYGDSLTAQAGEYLKSHGSVGVRFYPNMAPCSWIPNLASDPTDFTPQTVLLQFIGNQPVCINGRDPQQAYQRDLTTIAQFWKRRGVRVVMVLSPKTPPDNVAWARQAELRVANNLGLPVNNAGADVELPGEVFTFFLPCLPDETPSQGCGSEVPAQIRVREKDGIHFGTSPGYSSGARRFADAEARS
jgi:hypothetical protein